MVFGMISINGTGPFFRLLGKINETVYKEILKKHVPNLRTAIDQPAIFMQDNAPYHTANSIKTSLSGNNVTVMEWPAQSPDINPIEYLEVTKRKTQGKESKKRRRTVD